MFSKGFYAKEWDWSGKTICFWCHKEFKPAEFTTVCPECRAKGREEIDEP